MERLFDLVEESAWARLLVAQLGELLEQLDLFLVEVGRGLYAQKSHQRPATTSVEAGHALALQANDLAALRPGSDLEFLGPLQRGDLHRAPEGRDRHRYRDLGPEVVTRALERLVRRDPYRYVEIAGAT